MAHALARRILSTTTTAALAGALAAAGCGEMKTSTQPVDVSTVPTMPTPHFGQASLTGHVMDAAGQPIVGATLTIAETDGHATTDGAGAYTMAVPSDSTLTLFASATGLATSSRESVILAANSSVTDFDVMMLASSDVTAMTTLGGADPNGTHGLTAVRLHSLDPSCVVEGGHLTVWPPAAAAVIYSRPSATGGIDMPDPTVDGVQAGAQTPIWLAAAVPPGNMLQLAFDGSGCALMAESPSQGGLLFPGMRHVVAQGLTTMDLFLTATP